jgi:chromosome segregation ATPase
MPNETTRLERAKDYLLKKYGKARTIGDINRRVNQTEDLIGFADAECAALEIEIREFKDEVMQSDATIRRQKQRIESLTAQLADAKGELQKYQELFGIVPTLEDVENGTTELL